MTTEISSDKNTIRHTLKELMSQRVLLLDGSMGVMIQRLGLSEEQFRGDLLADHPVPLKGDNDILCITNPEVVADIHRQYLEAGADIIETNTFNATTLSQREYATDHLVREINLAGARIARKEADRYTTDLKPRFVAGSMGPTGLSASLSADINDPAARSVTFCQMREAFALQAGALIDGGVDLLIIETIFDALNAKAAIAGARDAMEQRHRDIPLVISMTVSDRSGRILSGHTPEALLSIIGHARPLAVGFNCSAGPATLGRFARRLAAESPYPTIFYPNAGLPDSMGRYAVTPAEFAGEIAPLLHEGIINIAGGCCGTTPAHIAALDAVIAKDSTPRRVPQTKSAWLAGMEEFADDRGFINIGERCNVAGSRKFLRLIKERNYDEAVAIARSQVADGAMILDINMDDGLLDAKEDMTRFLRLLTSTPEVASVPWMVDSSDFNVVRAALANISGRPIVNSISLKNGEEEFLVHAREILSFGAAVVVMAFDEQGQATTFSRKTEICTRAYRLLTEKVGFNPRDIIFDPNVLTIATGMPEHDRYALDFIRAVEWIHRNLPGAKTSGGVSNLSFSFRGNNYLRQAMHAVFLYHAIKAGLSMAIMDPGAKVTYDSIPADLLELLEDVILCRRPDASERLIARAGEFSSGVAASPTSASTLTDDGTDVNVRLTNALVSGDDSTLAKDLDEAVALHGGSANAVVEGPLMGAMEHVGQLFESGKMFLPQVVKSARTMHRAVEILRPRLEAGRKQGSGKGLFLLATVKGDVHDIGKNIAAVILRCNNFEVIDLGVQVEASAIVEAAKRHHPSFIGLSGLISPSLGEMVNVASELRRAGISTPLFVGGAATSELHTALRIAPAYGDGIVVRVADASRNPVIASRILADPEGERAAILRRQEALREAEADKANTNADSSCIPTFDWSAEPMTTPSFTGPRTLPEVPVKDLRNLINWIYFYSCWKVTPATEAAEDLRRDAEAMLDNLEASGATMRCRVAFYPAYSRGEAIVINGQTITTPRQQPSPQRKQLLALSDFVAPEGYGDHVGCFTVTIGDTLRNLLDQSDCETDSYNHLLLQSLCDRLAEATSEWLHYRVRTSLWGYAPDEPFDPATLRRGIYEGIRPAIGYPSLPDQSLMHPLARLTDPSEIGVTVTSNGALSPSSSIAGFYIRSPHARYFSVNP